MTAQAKATVPWFQNKLTRWVVQTFLVLAGLCLSLFLALRLPTPPTEGWETERNYPLPAIPASVSFQLIPYAQSGLALNSIEVFSPEDLWPGAKEAYGVVKIPTKANKNSHRVVLDLYAGAYPKFLHYQFVLAPIPLGNPGGAYVIANDSRYPKVSGTGKEVNVPFNYDASGLVGLIFVVGLVITGLAWKLVHELVRPTYIPPQW